MSRIIYFAFALTLAACSAQGESPEKAASFVIDSSIGAFSNIRTGMSERDLLRLGHSVSRRSIVLEGDEYAIIDVAIDSGVVIECLLDSGMVYRFSVTSKSVRDEKNIGVGSTLAELRLAYPQGKLLVGDEDGNYANFVNGSRVVFELDQRSIDLRCFDAYQAICDIDPSTEVVKVVVNSGPAGWR